MTTFCYGDVLSRRRFVTRRFVCAPSPQRLFWVSLCEENMPLFFSRIIKSCRCNSYVSILWLCFFSCVGLRLHGQQGMGVHSVGVRSLGSYSVCLHGMRVHGGSCMAITGMAKTRSTWVSRLGSCRAHG